MPDERKPKRKTHTSSAVKMRYNAKTYRKFTLTLRMDNPEDAVLIDAIDRHIVNGRSQSEAIKAIMRGE